jgi:hypothetical protein
MERERPQAKRAVSPERGRSTEPPQVPRNLVPTFGYKPEAAMDDLSLYRRDQRRANERLDAILHKIERMERTFQAGPMVVA